MSVLIVTGTDTGVGKTVATAAVASCARQAGVPVTVCKPVQTGTAAGDDDLAAVARLTGIATLTGGARYPQPLAPRAAAAAAGAALPTAARLRRMITGLDRPGRLTLVEGAGGLLVEIGADGLTLRDLAGDVDAAVLVVVAAGLGTLNHTALTLEAVARDRLRCAGLVIGSWPADPGPAETDNRAALARLAPLRAVLPAGAGVADPAAFAALSAAAFDPDWVAALAR
ncbi:ATP-dependent dethiobiotin synthetase BioD [Mycolicibacillus parakoreensis]|uniref:ATP-dependent dethiobiotin synthetase BioD n=1 Tax=Mycolicibacillus parakoreensis TaxID=1069221 RepID=A0ABY3U357_9MYCO|nr:dethiobiotin synthase [Mycolicibacillus parakoreensis]MCV7316762.1 ATP-dependent dethiobiotin synthetase BioD [Mycolicibacillus parakoreensis]ULN54383.1 dethiobiotin synthase [Mycolicibacillus parakoreensis]HLR99795.1 dethiobiotin synthase [Mycolicibacillus parakoreensis]